MQEKREAAIKGKREEQKGEARKGIGNLWEMIGGRLRND